MALPVPDTMVVEVVARSGGYEEVERAGLWANVAHTVGLNKQYAERIRERYEDMIKEADDANDAGDEEEDFEVDDILDLRIGDGGVEEYLVKWKGDYEDEADSMSWEPLSHLQGAMELVEKFNQKRERERQKEQKAAALRKAQATPPAAAPAAAGSATADPDAAPAAAEPAAAAPAAAPAAAGQAPNGAKKRKGVGCDEPYVEVLKVIRPAEEGQKHAFQARTPSSALCPPLLHSPRFAPRCAHAASPRGRCLTLRGRSWSSRTRGCASSRRSSCSTTTRRVSSTRDAAARIADRRRRMSCQLQLLRRSLGRILTSC